MNKVFLTGNVVKDAKVSDTANGGKRCAFSLAVSERKGDKKITVFVPIIAWGNYAESIAKYAVKGTRLLIEGELSIRPYEGESGKKSVLAEVVAERFESFAKADTEKEEEE